MSFNKRESFDSKTSRPFTAPVHRILLCLFAVTINIIPVLGTSANRSASPQIRKLRTQGFGLRICGPISYRKHLRICGKKIEIYRKSANQQHH